MKVLSGFSVVLFFLFSTSSFSQDTTLTLLTPIDGSVGLSTEVEFVWNEVEDATHYIYIVSTSPNFLPEFSTEFLTTDTSNIRSFQANTVFYWKMKALVFSQYTDFSEVFAFQTIIQPCTEYILTPGIEILDDDIYSSIFIGEDFNLTDVNVFLNVDHTYVGDLIINLITPGSVVNLVDNPGIPASNYGCSNDDIIITIDDQAEFSSNILENMCNDNPPAISGDFQSKDLALNDLIGTSSLGEWELEIIDTYDGEDFGVLNEWSIELCKEALNPQTYSFSSSPIMVPLGMPISISGSSLLFTEEGLTSSEIIYTILEVPEYSELFIEGELASIGSQFTQEMINQGLVEVTYGFSGNNSDSFVLDITSSSGNWIYKHEQSINVTDEFGGFVTDVQSVLCYGDTSGSVTLVGYNGVPPYEYSITGFEFFDSPVFTELAEGEHIFYIRDSELDIITVTAFISQPLNPLSMDVNAEGNDITCFGFGGTPPYQYSVDGGDFITSNVFNNLTDELHIISIMDNNLCIMSQEIMISSLYLSAYSIENASCFDSNDGSVILSIEGGTPPHKFRVDGGEWQSSILFTNLSGGDHTFEVQDSNDIGYSFDLYIDFPPELIITGIIEGDSIIINATGGVPPYLYSINGLNYFEYNIFSNLEPDNYTVNVLDANGCIIVYPFNIVSLSNIDNNIEVLVFPNPNDGSFTIETKGINDNLIFSLYNVSGQEVYNKEYHFTNGNMKINIQDLVEGMYFYKLLSVDKSSSYSGRFVVK